MGRAIRSREASRTCEEECPMTLSEHEQSLASLLPRGLPAAIDGHRFPGLYHCVGTDKLIGDLYGAAIVEECCLSKNVEPTLSELSCLLRAYIVIDDFVKDCGIDINRHPVLSLCLERIHDRCNHLVFALAPKAAHLWQTYHDVYERAYREFNQAAIYNSIISKCYLIFLPFDLPQVLCSERCKIVRRAMMDYLFCLQLMDDFQDMEEDIEAPRNHNLFIAGLERDMAQRVISYRPIIIRSLFEYIQYNVELVAKMFIGGTASRSIAHSTEWIAAKRKMLCNLPMMNIFHGDLPNFAFDPFRLLASQSSPFNLQIPELDDIRAESMHTRVD